MLTCHQQGYLEHPILMQHNRKSGIDFYVINKVKEKRLEKKISQVRLANELEVSVGFIGKIESTNYTSHYNLKHLNQLARILGCSPKDFLPGKPLK